MYQCTNLPSLKITAHSSGPTNHAPIHLHHAAWKKWKSIINWLYCHINPFITGITVDMEYWPAILAPYCQYNGLWHTFRAGIILKLVPSAPITEPQPCFPAPFLHIISSTTSQTIIHILGLTTALPPNCIPVSRHSYNSSVPTITVGISVQFPSVPKSVYPWVCHTTGTGQTILFVGNSIDSTWVDPRSCAWVMGLHPGWVLGDPQTCTQNLLK